MAANRGTYQEAQTSYLQALEIARHRENWDMVSTLLQDLGALVSCWGDYEQAYAYYQEGLEYASQLKDIYRQSAILMNLGLLAFYRQRYDEAMTLSLDSLCLARTIDNEFRISSVLQNLGMMEGFFGHDAQAEIYLQESLSLAQKIGHRWLTCETRGEWGALYLRQQKWDAAGEIFEEMMTEAQEIGAQQLQALTLFGLARAEKGRGHHQAAQQYATESLAYFQRLKDHRSSTVEQWLSEHGLD